LNKSWRVQLLVPLTLQLDVESSSMGRPRSAEASAELHSFLEAGPACQTTS